MSAKRQNLSWNYRKEPLSDDNYGEDPFYGHNSRKQSGGWGGRPAGGVTRIGAWEGDEPYGPPKISQ